MNLEWIPIEKELPTTANHILVCTKDGVVTEADYVNIKHNADANTYMKEFLDSNSIIAWMPMPEPYKKKDTNREVGFFINWKNISRKRTRGVER